MNINKIIMIFIIFIFTIIFYKILFDKEHISLKTDFDLKKDGLYIVKNMVSEQNIELIKSHSKNKNYKEIKSILTDDQNNISLIKSILTNDYEFQDYIWIIEKSHVHTCHRDNNGTFFNKDLKYPSYTLLVFLESMDKNIGVISKSHININDHSFNIANNIEYIKCNKGDAILFDANLVHVGASNKNPNNLRIQLKVTHKDDRKTISYYENYHKVQNQTNNLPPEIVNMQKNLTCMFPIISDLSQSKSVKFDKEKESSPSTKLFQQIFYGNASFYGIDNVF